MKETLKELSITNAYLEGLAESPNDQLYVDGIGGLCALSKDERLGIFKELVDGLNRYKVGKNKASQRIKKAWGVIENYFLSKSEDLKKYSLIPLVYGSVVFDDPRNLDYDLLLVGNNNKNIDKMLDCWDREFFNQWKDIGSRGHFSYLNFDSLKTSTIFLNSNSTDYAREYAETIDLLFMHAGTLFTGQEVNSNDPRFREINDKLPSLREEFFKVAVKNPILMSTIIRNLQETLIVRERRRNGLDI